MKVFNIRRGHACNSSSSHSIVTLRDGNTIVDDYDPYSQFGWDNFTLASQQAKSLYMKAQIASNISGRWYYKNPGLARELMLKYTVTGDMGVDHQSVIGLPSDWSDMDLHSDYLEDFKTVLLRDDVVILGGNDSDESGHPARMMAGPGPTVKTGTGTFKDRKLFGLSAVARKDGDYYSLYDRESGHKVRMSFKDIEAPQSSTWPELVDIKVTDFCDFGCSYCYQGSTTRGKHANTAYIKSVIDALAEAQVFEVAFGGGEPTDHPDFLEILQYTADKKITPNFTTRNVKYLCDNYAALASLIGSVAISIDTHEEGQKANASLAAAKPDDKANLSVIYQVVVGAVSTAELDKMYGDRAIGGRITLLGWKDNHRGATATKVDCDWPTVVKAHGVHKWGLRVDTAFVDEFKPTLVMMDADPVTIGAGEGRFSCYVDAVAKKIAPSSYCPDDEYLLFDKVDLADKWKLVSNRAVQK